MIEQNNKFIMNMSLTTFLTQRWLYSGYSLAWIFFCPDEYKKNKWFDYNRNFALIPVSNKLIIFF